MILNFDNLPDQIKTYYNGFYVKTMLGESKEVLQLKNGYIVYFEKVAHFWILGRDGWMISSYRELKDGDNLVIEELLALSSN